MKLLRFLAAALAAFLALPTFADPVAATAPVEILCMGDSQTNGRGVAQSNAYPAQLERLLKAAGRSVSVVNAGVDGDPSSSIYHRMTQAVTPHTRMVIYLESGNDLNPASGVEYTEKSLAWLRERQIPTILLSNRRIHPDEEAAALAGKYGAHYYGWWKKDVPNDGEHVQPGEFFAKKNKVDFHLTTLGYGIIAQNLAPLVQRLLDENRPTP